MTLEDELRKAAEAKQVLEAPIFIAARANLEAQLAEARRVVPIRETEMHTRLILMEQLAQRFFGYFEQIAQTGKMAQIQLEKSREQQSMLERGIAMFRTSGRNAL